MNEALIVNTARDPVATGALGLLEARIGARARAGRIPQEGPRDCDLEVTLATRPPVKLLAIVRKPGRLIHDQIRHVILAAQILRDRFHKPVLFLAPWIEDGWGEELRAAGVFYIDLQGNVYLRLKKPLIQLEAAGHRPAARLKADPGRLIEPSGLKVLHLLLTQPEAVNRPYRKLAPEAGVALGTVGVVMRELKAAGNLVRTGRDAWRIEKRAALIDLFVRGYALKLRPACVVGRFRHRERDTARVLERLGDRLGRGPGRWVATGGTAAEILTKYLHPDTVTLFVDKAGAAVLKDEPLLTDPAEGPVILLDYFAPTIEATGKARAAEGRTATPLLVYAELLNDGRGRELETAKMIYERFLTEEHGGG